MVKSSSGVLVVPLQMDPLLSYWPIRDLFVLCLLTEGELIHSILSLCPFPALLHMKYLTQY